MMKETQYLMFDSNGLKTVKKSQIPEYYNTFNQNNLLDLNSIIFKLDEQSFLEYNLISKVENDLNNTAISSLKMSFIKIECQETELKMKLIESRMPELISHIAHFGYRTSSNSLKELIGYLESQNPLKFDQSKGHPFYEHNLKKLLFTLCLTNWPKGTNNYTNGLSFINGDGKLIYCHVSDQRSFLEFLIENTQITTKSGMERIYEENGELFIKLNLQIRFK
ncbi:hypothetical protein DHW03_08985 [Pedobacter yonginense]|uniref:HpaII family restriction endonuclease n=1 Tax=Pedobacter yonginense TaxID=651869 RepID=A0A317EMR6_9SPHI|nr:HpaII family restriction endonuclease [Pedobacter yonginense]PWS27705.1 hypothetical protein DHW03_08985 [Pedobacter yonginense]